MDIDTALELLGGFIANRQTHYVHKGKRYKYKKPVYWLYGRRVYAKTIVAEAERELEKKRKLVE